MSPVARRVGIAIGSNIEPRYPHILAAREFLKTLHEGPLESFRFSSVYETEPVDCPLGSPWFLNAAAELLCSLQPLPLLHRLQAFERSSGRPAVRERNTPRTVDLDVLYVGDVVMSGPPLELPHPRIAARPFVVVPLAEIAPAFVLPKSASSIGALAADADLTGLRKWEESP